jgi:hypothetical protein
VARYAAGAMAEGSRVARTIPLMSSELRATSGKYLALIRK